MNDDDNKEELLEFIRSWGNLIVAGVAVGAVILVHVLFGIGR